MPTHPHPRTRSRRKGPRTRWRGGRRAERRRITALLRTETVGGGLLVAAAVVAVIVANSPLQDAYRHLRDLRLGPHALDLNLTVAQWSADGLLAIFFFLAGLELKREFVMGDLADPRRAAVPVAAAVGGMAVPAGIYLAITASDPGLRVGWAIPTATDIAFALAVLAVVGRNLPAVLRTFLLALAVVDDLLAIVVIALFYTRDLHVAFLGASVVVVALFGLAVQRTVTAWWVLLPLAAIAWALMHASGVHATVAGVLMGFTVPVRGRPAEPSPHDRRGRRQATVADRLEHRLRPISAGLAVPLFAFFAAGVSVGGPAGLAQALTDRLTLGVVVALLVGKAVGIGIAAVLAARITGSSMLRDLASADLIGLSVLGGVGFTVSLLIGELAFGPESEHTAHVRIAVLVGSLASAVVAGTILSLRNRHYRRRSCS